MGIILLIVGVSLFSLNNVVWKKTILNSEIPYLIFIKSFFTSLAFGFVLYIELNHNYTLKNLQEELSVNLYFLLSTILLSTFSFFGIYFYLKSLEKENPSLTIAVSSINIFGLLASFLILGEKWKNIYFIVFLLIFSAIFILYRNAENKKKSNSIKLAILASFFWGISYTLFKLPIQKYGVILFTFILESTICIFCLVLFVRKFSIFKSIPIKYLSINILCTILASYFLHKSYLYLTTKDIIIFQKIDIPISLILSYIIFKERPKLIQIIAILIIFLALLVTGIFS